MLDLETAIAKTKRIYDADRRSFTSRSVIVKHLGYKDETSGKGNRELAALKQYGLLEEKADQFRVSDAGYSIVFLSEASQERRNRISEAATSPAIFRDLWEQYGNDGSDETLRDYLIHRKNFNPASVTDVIGNYKSTISFAKLTILSHPEAEGESKNGEESKKHHQPPTNINAGDLVQWESQGVLQFKEPRRVRAVSEDKQWAFLDGSATGVPVSELELVGKVEAPKSSNLVRRPPPQLPLPAESVIFSWPLSKGVVAEVKLTGADITPAHLELLRSYLELAKQAMAIEESPD